MSNRAIAARLFVTERTVEAHVTQILLKLGLAESPDQHRRVLAVLDVPPRLAGVEVLRQDRGRGAGVAGSQQVGGAQAFVGERGRQADVDDRDNGM